MKRSMMELKITRTKKLLLVFAMIFVRATLQMDTAASSTNIQKVEEHLLSRLGLKRRPIVDRKKAQIPQVMLNLYKQKTSQEFESAALPLPGSLTRSANIVRSYTHQESSIDEKFPHGHKFRLHFDFPDLAANEIVTSAELKLSIVPKENRPNYAPQHIYVHDIVKPGIKGKSKPILRLVDTQVINRSSDLSVVSLDVLPIVERWSNNHTNNYGLLVDVRSPAGDKVHSHVRLRRDVDHREWSTVQPVLLVYSDDSTIDRPTNWTDIMHKRSISRQKRSSTPRKSKRQPSSCKRFPLRVEFAEVGWKDWIVAPDGYDAYYCAGECSGTFPDNSNVSNHAIVQSLMHSIHPNVIPMPCCVPTTMNPISMLYLDDNSKAVMKTYHDMVVVGCGCR